MSGRYFHAGLVTLKGDQGLFCFYLITVGDQNFNDLDGIVVANIGHANFYRLRHSILPRLYRNRIRFVWINAVFLHSVCDNTNVNGSLFNKAV